MQGFIFGLFYYRKVEPAIVKSERVFTQRQHLAGCFGSGRSGCSMHPPSILSPPRITYTHPHTPGLYFSSGPRSNFFSSDGKSQTTDLRRRCTYFENNTEPPALIFDSVFSVDGLAGGRAIDGLALLAPFVIREGTQIYDTGRTALRD